MKIIPSDEIEEIVSAEVSKDVNLVELQLQANKMVKFAMSKGGVGLSGCQVDDFRKFFVWNQGRWNDQALADYRIRQGMLKTPEADWDKVGLSGPTYIWKLVINPEYRPEKGGEVVSRESCLSYPGRAFVLKRHRKIWATYWIIQGNKLVRKSRTLTGYPAVIFQHETDHTNGITIKMIGVELERKKKSEVPVKVEEKAS